MEMKINTSSLEDRVIEATNIDEALSILMNTLVNQSKSTFLK